MNLRLGASFRALLVLACLLVSIVAFAACRDDGGGTVGEGSPAGGGERIDGGELTVQSLEFASLDPHFSGDNADISLERMLWRGLYTLDKDNVPQPAMASAEPEISDDGLTYTIKLRDGLKWSDGDNLTADDFVAGIHRTCNPKNAGQYEYLLSNLAGCDAHYTNEAGFDPELEEEIGVRAVDPSTIEFQILEPQPTFPMILSLWMTFPSPVHLLAHSSDPWPSGPDAPNELAYNGPYVLTDYSPQDSVTLEPNPEWAAPANVSPTLDQITVKFIEDLSQATNAYRTGEIMATAADVTQLEALKSDFGENEEYFNFIGPVTASLAFQLAKEPLDKLEVRLALSQAIDREELNRVVSQGGHQPTTSWVPEVSGGAAPDAFDDAIGFDPDKAKENLAKAGFPDGEGFPELAILTIDAPAPRLMAVFLQEAFRTNLNIDVSIETVDGKGHAMRFTEEQFELTFNGWLQDYPDPENWVIGMFETKGSLNHTNCSDPDIDALIEEARFNTDNAERLRLYQDVNELIVTRVCGLTPLRHEARHWLINPNIIGMRENLAGEDATIAGDWAAEYWGLSE